MQNYDLLIDRIAKATDINRDEIENKVEAKKAKLSGLISKEGAAQIIAAELGVSFENQDVKISELMPGMRKVNVVGKILQLFSIREFERNGRSGKVANFRFADETGNCRVVLWDVNHISLLESGEIKEGDVVEIRNASTKDTEIHLSSFSEFKKSATVIDDVKVENEVKEADISGLLNGQSVRIRGIVVQMFPIRFYNVCPECNKKVVASLVDGGESTVNGDESAESSQYKCAEHGSVVPNKKGILNFVLDDGTESIRTVLFSDAINKLSDENELADEGKFEIFRKDFLGSEVYVSGDVRRNSLFNNLELIGNEVEIVDLEKLIVVLEAKT